MVEGNRMWFVTSRGEVRCLDVEGFLDGEDDGPVQGETARVANIPLASDGGKSAMGGLAEGKLSESFNAAMTAAGEEVSGDVTVESKPGQGSRFTLRLLKASEALESDTIPQADGSAETSKT